MANRKERIEELMRKVIDGEDFTFKWANHSDIRFWYDEEKDAIVSDCGIKEWLPLIEDDEITEDIVRNVIQDLQDNIYFSFLHRGVDIVGHTKAELIERVLKTDYTKLCFNWDFHEPIPFNFNKEKIRLETEEGLYVDFEDIDDIKKKPFDYVDRKVCELRELVYQYYLNQEIVIDRNILD